MNIDGGGSRLRTVAAGPWAGAGARPRHGPGTQEPGAQTPRGQWQQPGPGQDCHYHRPWSHLTVELWIPI